MRKLIVRLLIVPLVLAVCSGCAIDVGLQPPSAAEHYMLAVSTESPAQTAMHAVPTVSVGRPQANAFLNSTGIAVLQPNQQVLYYAKGQWATVLPEMMQTAAIHSLNSTQLVRSFNNTQSGIAADYKLVWSIEDFYARYAGKKYPPQIYVTFNCWLIDTDKALEPVASSVFAGNEIASGQGLVPIVESFNRTVKTILNDMNAWVTCTIERQQLNKQMHSTVSNTGGN
ncbi:ABC-type transport auxiliary lipoprotein family protein [Halodesulfovibrio sp. MK-HDV]|jgi:ABC-type uncharacterized transport system auxiliary subunit|uniref:ABC-type transport auxiliary lipoprotein family protein n=1 Tax=unclassified Halodesulfovibrio TaxID=2644657 RepID=UPI00136FF238|nr:ABC-type transport auxiliary lipoprotein family protein [Halodesulfovibrio sp. MK-HDV]KAF1074652.1 hypothetical protein MKHDV_02729 [Halodesulfovibrio sp. MK-HDV]